MNAKAGYLSLVIAILALGVVLFRAPHTSDSASKKETAYERVMHTRTLRCAYSSRAHHFMRRADNKTISGIDYEIMEAIGKAAHIKIEWAEEVGLGAFPVLLNSGKQDAMCTPVWASVTRAQRVVASAPILYSPLYAYVREDDHRFNNNLEAINNEKVTIAVVDSSPGAFVAETAFPKAKPYALPIDNADSDRVLAVATGKADVVLVDEATAGSYNEHNAAHKIRRVSSSTPVRMFPETFYVAMNEWALREFLNAGIADLQNNGTLDRILDKYEPDPTAIARVASPYHFQKQ